MSFSEWTQEGGWISTHTGKRVYLLDPNPEDICIEDIAHALSNICRWGGHTSRFYSVAEHSLRICDHCCTENKLWGLLHDASEAYMGDVCRPLKQLLPTYRDMESKFHKVIAYKFNLSEDIPDEVHEIDCRILQNEGEALVWGEEQVLGPSHVGRLEQEDITTEYKGLKDIGNPNTVKELFLERFQELHKQTRK